MGVLLRNKNVKSNTYRFVAYGISLNGQPKIYSSLLSQLRNNTWAAARTHPWTGRSMSSCPVPMASNGGIAGIVAGEYPLGFVDATSGYRYKIQVGTTTAVSKTRFPDTLYIRVPSAMSFTTTGVASVVKLIPGFQETNTNVNTYTFEVLVNNGANWGLSVSAGGIYTSTSYTTYGTLPSARASINKAEYKAGDLIFMAKLPAAGTSITATLTSGSVTDSFTFTV